VLTKKGLTRKRVVGATALIVVAAAIGTVPALAGEGPDEAEVGEAVSWESADGAAYISDTSNQPTTKKWRREHKHGAGPYPGRFQEEVSPEQQGMGSSEPQIPPGVGDETGSTGAATSMTSTWTTSPSTGTGTPEGTASIEGYTTGDPDATAPGQPERTTSAPSETSWSPTETETSSQATTSEAGTSDPVTSEATTSPAQTGAADPQATGSVEAEVTSTPSASTTGGSGLCSEPTTTEPTAGVEETGTMSPTAPVTPNESITTAEPPLVSAGDDAAVETTATVTATAGGGTEDSGADTLTPCSIENRSGLPWGASGLYMPGSSAANAEAFAAWRGAPVDVVVDWPARQTWDDIVNPTWIFDAWKDTPYIKALGVAPVPEGDSSATMAGCAAGDYNDKWVQFGQNFVNNGMGDSIIRLGWEFNGNWYKWGGGDPATYAECWRQIVTTTRTVAPDLVWDWTVNRGVSAGMADASQAYPGDEYVDIVGIDSYDMWPGVNNDQTWEEHYSGDFGLQYWANFAAEHGKKVSTPEWGVYPGSAQAGHNGGDNALYIDKMIDFFTDMGADLAYEAYFNEDASYYAGAIFEPTQNPNAADTYKARIAAIASGDTSASTAESDTQETAADTGDTGDSGTPTDESQTVPEGEDVYSTSSQSAAE